MLVLIDWPARMIGELAALLFSLAGLAAMLASGGYTYGFLLPRMSEVRKPLRKVFAGAGAALVGLYVGAVLYRSQHWVALGLLEAARN